MVQQQFAGRDAADEQALSHDRHRIDLQVFTNNDEGGFHGQGMLRIYRNLKNTTCTICTIIKASITEVEITWGASQTRNSRCR